MTVSLADYRQLLNHLSALLYGGGQPQSVSIETSKKSKKCKWSNEEDKRLIELMQGQTGLRRVNWKRISELLGPDKNSIQCREAWTKRLGKKININPATIEEFAFLIKRLPDISSKPAQVVKELNKYNKEELGITTKRTTLFVKEFLKQITENSINPESGMKSRKTQEIHSFPINEGGSLIKKRVSKRKLDDQESKKPVKEIKVAGTWSGDEEQRHIQLVQSQTALEPVGTTTERTANFCEEVFHLQGSALLNPTHPVMTATEDMVEGFFA